jgi:hypothetical protein
MSDGDFAIVLAREGRERRSGRQSGQTTAGVNHVALAQEMRSTQPLSGPLVIRYTHEMLPCVQLDPAAGATVGQLGLEQLPPAHLLIPAACRSQSFA